MVNPVQETSHGNSELVTLEPYEEIVGYLEAISRDDRHLEIELSAGRLRFPSGSKEAEICWSELNDAEGLKVSILRVPIQAAPLSFNIGDSVDHREAGA